METSVLEYIDLLYGKLGKLAFEEIQYSDYDQMTDWLAEINKQVKKFENKQEPMRPVNDHCKCGEDVRNWTGDEPFNYCPNCGQKLDWEDSYDE